MLPSGNSKVQRVEQHTRLLWLLFFFYGLFHGFSLLLETLPCGQKERISIQKTVVISCNKEYDHMGMYWSATANRQGFY